MKKTRLIVLMLLGLVGAAHSQTIKGKVVDLVDNKPLAGATLTLTSVKDTLKKFNTLADATGAFQFTGVSKDSFFFKMTYREYDDFRQLVALNDSMPSADLGTLFIPKKTTTLNDVTVTAKVPPVQQKGDTAQYNASQFKVNPDATVEDLVKKMPGITVGRDGSVTAQGQSVQKVTLDGRDFFGDDATAALRNLPADVVDKIQVFDRMSDQAQFTGFDDGSGQRSINIITKSGVTNGQFGRIYAGYGTDSRYAAGGNVSFFKGNKRISFVGNFNNINQQNFASQDILGAMTGGGGGGARGGGGGGGGNFGGGGMGGGNFGGGAGGFGMGQQSGISKTNGLGINFGDKWGKKLDVQGSYFFNNSNNVNDQQQNSLTPIRGGSILEQDQSSNSLTKNTNHRVNMRLTYTIDQKNSIIFTPNVSFQNTNSDSRSITSSILGGNPTNFSDNTTISKRNGFNARNTILWRHAFAKRGRTLTVNLNTSLNRNSSESQTTSKLIFYDKGIPEDSLQNQFRDNLTDGYTLSANVSYTEPIGKSSQLQFSYQPSYTKNNADQKTFDYDSTAKGYTTFKPTLSNEFENTTITQSGGVTYRLGATRDNQLSFGFNVQFTELNSDRQFPGISTFSQKFTNLLPNLMWRKKISPKSSFQIFYRANTQTPSVTQLQDVLNNSSATNVSIGNPELKQSFTQVFTGRYTFTNTQKGQSFFANFSGQFADNYIANANYVIGKDTLIQAQSDSVKKGSNFTKPLNFDGYKSFSTFFTFSQPINIIKSNLSLSAGINYSTIPSLRVDTLGIKTDVITKNLGYNTGVVMASNINEYIDFNLSYNANFSNVKSNVAKANHSVTQSAGAQINLLSKSGWFLQNDVSYQKTSGLTAGNNTAYTLWNAAAGKKLFKKRQAELKISVFDLLKQNQAITRTINGDGAIVDSRSRVLTQYFMLTFTYSLKSFGKPAARTNTRGEFQREGGNFGPGGFGGGMPGGFGGGRPNF